MAVVDVPALDRRHGHTPLALHLQAISLARLPLGAHAHIDCRLDGGWGLGMVFRAAWRLAYRTHALIALVCLCERIEGNLTLSHEHLNARYWPIEAVTEWHANLRDYAVAAHALWKSLNAQHKA
jgi:hypothetical protein